MAVVEVLVGDKDVVEDGLGLLQVLTEKVGIDRNVDVAQADVGGRSGDMGEGEAPLPTALGSRTSDRNPNQPGSLRRAP